MYYKLIEKGDDYAKHVAMQALCQIKPRIFCSWGVEKRIAIYWKGMPTLGIFVNGFLHKGWVFVSLNEGSDTYEVFTCVVEDEDKEIKIVQHKVDIFCDMLTDTIDGMVEKDPSWTDEEYNSKVDAWLEETA